MTLTKKVYEENQRRIEEDGIEPEELSFSFTCLQCGHRCCSENAIEYVLLSPYTAAYINSYKPIAELDVAGMINKGLLETYVGDVSGIPQVRPRPELIYCPFLMIDWTTLSNTSNIKLVFENKLDKDIVLTLAVIEKEIQQCRIPILQLESIIKKGLTNEEGKGPTKKEVDQLLYGFLEKFVLDEEKPIKTICAVYAARPPICKIHPLGRLTKYDKEREETTSKVIKTNNNCPKEACTGKKQSAKEYLIQQGIRDQESRYKWILLDWIKENRGFVEHLDREESTFTALVFHELYTQPGYKANKEEFYQSLEKSLQKCIEKFEDLRDRFPRELWGMEE